MLCIYYKSILFKVDKYKVQTEFAERLVEKSRQLELETQVTRLGENQDSSS